MFNRLLKLHSKANSNTPIEDFSTEIFAFILDKDPKFQSEFTSKVLYINEEKFEVATQKRYSIEGENYAVIDIVLSNRNKIIFIENKVESSEGENQLDKYSKVLEKLSEYEEKHLAYCTKYYDPKEEKRHNFKQYRWHHIADILEKSDNSIAIEFYKFLKNYNMTKKNDFNTKDLFHLENLKETFSFLDSFLERIRPRFADFFGKPSNPDYSSQMRKYNRYSFFKSNVFGSGSNNEIGVGFKFEEEPQAYIWIWTTASNTKSSEFNKYLTSEFSDFFDYYDRDFCLFSIDLKFFIGKENSMMELENWYFDKFDELKTFVEKTPDLIWKLN